MLGWGVSNRVKIWYKNNWLYLKVKNRKSVINIGILAYKSGSWVVKNEKSGFNIKQKKR